MPHKKNPISAENLTGCARLLRGYAIAALESVPLWHERDISHSSVERVIAPDATTLVDYMLHRLAGTLMRLRVNEGRVRENLAFTRGTIYSGHVLLKCVEKGMSREDAYVIVQRTAHAAIEKKVDFVEALMGNRRISKLFTRRELDRILDCQRYLRHVDSIYRKVLGS